MDVILQLSTMKQYLYQNEPVFMLRNVKVMFSIQSRMIEPANIGVCTRGIENN